jgi:YaiO family outer membrane protein
MRILLFLILTYLPSILLAQIDSSWQSNVTLRYENGLVLENAAKYTVKTAEMSIKKLSATFVPRVAKKSIHNLTGVQFGTAVYKEVDWGYIDGTMLYSGSTIYPTVTLIGNGNLNIFKGLSVTTGIQFYQYSDRNKRSVISLGSTYYWEAWMGTYMIYRNDNNTYSQKVVTRRYLASDRDYIQLGIYYGYFEASNMLGSSDELSSNTFQFAFHKTIWKAIQIQISFSSVGTNSNDYTSRSTNIMMGIKKTF